MRLTCSCLNPQPFYFFPFCCVTHLKLGLVYLIATYLLCYWTRPCNVQMFVPVKFTHESRSNLFVVFMYFYDVISFFHKIEFTLQDLCASVWVKYSDDVLRSSHATHAHLSIGKLLPHTLTWWTPTQMKEKWRFEQWWAKESFNLLRNQMLAWCMAVLEWWCISYMLWTTPFLSQYKIFWPGQPSIKSQMGGVLKKNVPLRHMSLSFAPLCSIAQCDLSNSEPWASLRHATGGTEFPDSGASLRSVQVLNPPGVPQWGRETIHHCLSPFQP